MKKSILFSILVFLSAYMFSQSISNDESYLDDTFWEFKMQLADCIIKKDKVLLYELLNDKVLDCWDSYDCAGLEGCEKNNFISHFFNTEKSVEWEILKKIVQFGFYRTIDTTKYRHIDKKMDSIVFRGPSFSKNLFNEKSKKVLVLAENLNLRAEPSINSKILKTISYGSYNCETEETGYVSVFFGSRMEWLKLVLEDGTTGYVSRKFTSEFISRTLTVAKIDNEWKIIIYYCHLDI